MVRRRAAMLALAVLSLLSLTGCRGNFLPRARDITQVQLMRTLAFDLGEEADSVRVTVSGTTRRAGEQGQSQPPLILTREGYTVFGACFSLQKGSDGSTVDYGHVTEFVLGEEIAREQLEGLIDYLERDFEMRLDTQVYLVAGATAEEAVTGSSCRNSALTDRLSAISQDQSLGGRQWPYTLRYLLSQLEDNGCALLPVLTLEENPDYDPEQPGEEPEQNVTLSGLAYFGDRRLAGLLSREESRGAALLTDLCQSDSVEITLPGGAAAGITLVNASCYWEPHFDGDGRLARLVARIRVQGELSELRGAVDPFDAGQMDELERLFSAELERQAQAALDRSQSTGVDFLHLRREMVFQCPLHTGELSEHWEEWFPALELEAVVEGRIVRSYDVNRTAEGEDTL